MKVKTQTTKALPHTDRLMVREPAQEPPLSERFEAHQRAWARNPDILQTHHRIFLGDAREMRALGDEPSVHLVVTSPPYWDLKKYPDHSSAQLGNLHDKQQFFGELRKVWKRCFDLLVPGGRMCVVVGDVCRSRRQFGRHLVEPLHAQIQIECQETGLDPLAPIIWNKIANAVTEVKGNGSTFLGKPYEPNAIVKNDIEFILLFRKPGEYRHPTREQRDLSMIRKEDHRRWFQQVWTDVPGDLQREHPAPFPKEIARRLIGMFSFVGDTVLDPFCGLATTSLSAIDMHRSSVCYEIEREYFEAARLRLAQLPFDATIEFVDRDAREV
jgi:site-specific DNA-methyltransferase (adenine-specific)